jgi:hypothetical protein
MLSRSFERRERTARRASVAKKRYKMRYTTLEDRSTSCLVTAPTTEYRGTTGHLDVGLIDEGPFADTVPARPCGVDDQRREPLHPPVDGDVIDVDAALSQELFDIAVGQPVAEVPAHQPARSRPAGTGIERTTEMQDGDDESPEQVRSRPRSVKAAEPATVPPCALGVRPDTTSRHRRSRPLIDERARCRRRPDPLAGLSPDPERTQRRTFRTRSPCAPRLRRQPVRGSSISQLTSERSSTWPVRCLRMRST